MDDVIPLETGLQEAFEWYRNNEETVNRKNYLEYIDKELTD
jgi:dTDP-D-glucose 4,6-dehydratase